MIDDFDSPALVPEVPVEKFAQRFLSLPSGMKVILLYCASMAFMAFCYLGSNKIDYGDLPIGMMANIMGFLSIIAFAVAGYWIFHRNRNGAFVLIGWTALTAIQGAVMVPLMFQNPALMGAAAETNPLYAGGVDTNLFAAMGTPIMFLMIGSGLTYLAAMTWYLFWKQGEYFRDE